MRCLPAKNRYSDHASRFLSMAVTIAAMSCLVNGFSSGDVVAQETQDAKMAEIELKSDVLELVDGLDAPTLKQRKGSERALIELGAKALPYLPGDDAALSVEASERLARVKTEIRSQKTEVEVDLLTIRLGDVENLGEALEEISRVSQIEFEYDAPASTPITPIATPLSFWHALDLILDECQLGIDFYDSDQTTLKLIPRDESLPRRSESAAYAGVYRIEPTSVTARRVLKQPDLSSLNVNIEIAWEPRVTPIGLTIPIAELTGKLDDGAKLQPQSSGDTIDIATSNELALSEFYLPMLLPAGNPTKIESLSGMIKAMLPGKRELFELKLDDVSPSKTIDAMTVSIEQIRKDGPLHAVRVGVKLDNAQRSLESHRQWLFQNEIFIRRKDGSRNDHLGYEVYRQTSDGVGISYLFDLGDAVDEDMIVYQSPTSVVENEVPFLIQEIKLP